MAHLRRLLAYCVCVAIATPPMAYGQNAPAATKASTPQPSALTGVSLSGSQQPTHARLLMNWPKGTSLSGNASIGQGLLLIRLPRAVDVDPMIFARAAPQFVGGAAMSADKRTIRLALLQGARVVASRDGDTQAFDVVLADAPDPEPFRAPTQQSAARSSGEAGRPADSGGPLKKMINGAAPEGAPRVAVETAVSKEFTRIRLTNTVPGATLPTHGYARTGDRMAIAMAGQYALDIAEIRATPPPRVQDSARYNSSTDTALVMALEPGAVVRHSREGNSILVDIMPPGTDPNSLDALLAQAAANVGAPSPTKGAGAPAPSSVAGTQVGAQTPPAETATALANVDTPAERPDPAPSGRVIVTPASQGTNMVLEFGFEMPAPAVVFRRGDSIYALFATKADFDVTKIRPTPSASAVTPIKGEGVSGVRIVAPPQVNVSANALGGNWRLILSSAKAAPSRTITIEREKAADGTNRIKALVPDGAATGSIVDPVVGDTILLGLALGPATPLPTPRSFLEVNLPETFHGLAVTPRTEDFALRRSGDGFVLVRPMGMALSGADGGAVIEGFSAGAPGFVDYKAWQVGPKADFLRNLDALRRAAAEETNGPNEGVRKRLDLVRFLVAWDLGPEAGGTLAQIKAAVPAMARSPEFIALEGIANVLMKRGKEALEILSQPEVANDPSSQLWAGLAAQQEGNDEEALTRFVRGASALDKFVPEQRALFLLAHARAALGSDDAALANRLASQARDAATSDLTKQRAQMVIALAQAKAGQVEEALGGLTKLEASPDRELASQAKFEKAIIGFESGRSSLPDTIRALDALRYAWRGDDLEINVLRRLGGLYIQGGDIRSGLTTMTSATSLRTSSPAARLLRDELFKQFKYLFLEGGADGMPPVQALALFYDFKDLAPIGPEGDRMVRGLADRLVALDLLPQATQLLQHQVDKRLEGYAKAQVATDLAAIYLMDRRAEPALKALWNSRVTQLPEALNSQRRLIEAAALAELGRTEHAIELIEFDTGQDAARLRTELYMRANNWTLAAANARATLPPAKANFEPEEAGEVLRAAIATSMANEQAGVAALVANYGEGMGKSAYAEAFKVVTDPNIPDPAAIQSAMASIAGGSPYNGLMKRLRTRLSEIEATETAMRTPDGPTDGNPQGFTRTSEPLVPEAIPDVPPTEVAAGAGATAPATADASPSPAPASAPAAVPAATVETAAAPKQEAPARPARRPDQRPTQRAASTPRPAPAKAKSPQRATPTATAKAPAKAPARGNSVQAPRDPPPAPVTAR